MLRQFVDALPEDNPTLLKNDPTYLDRVRGQADKAMVGGWLRGDWSIVSGAMYAGVWDRQAALLAELDHVPVRVHTVSRAENPDEFLKLLVEMNSQRIKSASELVHESIIKIDPKAAHQQIINERVKKANQRNVDRLSVIDPLEDGRR